MDTADTALSADNRQLVAGAIDCDVHPRAPTLAELKPFLPPFWQESLEQRGMRPWDSVAYPAGAAMTRRADWKVAKGGSDLATMQSALLDRFGLSVAILNSLYGVQVIMAEDMGAAFTSALNDWIAREWLDRDPRLRASIVVPMQSPQMAAAEIERCAADRRFVQVLMLVMGEMPLGKRYHWPIYEAAVKHGLPVAIHSGSMYRHATTGIGWPSFHSQDYFSQSVAFQTQLTSLVTEGVFKVHPDLRIVFSESGITWLPAHLWRLDKYWRGLRTEIPWVERPPSEIVAQHFRFTLQPVDAPPRAESLARVFDQIGSDELFLFSSDYPHWQFDGDAIVPEGLPRAVAEKMMTANPRATYARLKEA